MVVAPASSRSVSSGRSRARSCGPITAFGDNAPAPPALVRLVGPRGARGRALFRRALARASAYRDVRLRARALPRDAARVARQPRSARVARLRHRRARRPRALARGGRAQDAALAAVLFALALLAGEYAWPSSATSSRSSLSFGTKRRRAPPSACRRSSRRRPLPHRAALARVRDDRLGILPGSVPRAVALPAHGAAPPRDAARRRLVLARQGHAHVVTPAWADRAVTAVARSSSPRVRRAYLALPDARRGARAP